MYEVRIIANYLGTAADVFRTAIDTPYLNEQVGEILRGFLDNLSESKSIDDVKKLIMSFIEKAFELYEKLPFEDREEHYDLLEIKKNEVERVLGRIADKDFRILYNTFEAVLEDLLGEVESE